MDEYQSRFSWRSRISAWLFRKNPRRLVLGTYPNGKIILVIADVYTNEQIALMYLERHMLSAFRDQITEVLGDRAIFDGPRKDV